MGVRVGVGDEDTGVGLGTWDLGPGTWGTWEHGRGREPRLDPARLDFFGILPALCRSSLSHSLRLPGPRSGSRARAPGQGTAATHKVQSRYLTIPLAARQPAKYRPRSHLANDGTTQPASTCWAQHACLVLSCLGAGAGAITVLCTQVPYRNCRIVGLLGPDRAPVCTHLSIHPPIHPYAQQSAILSWLYPSSIHMSLISLPAPQRCSCGGIGAECGVQSSHEPRQMLVCLPFLSLDCLL